MAMFKGKLLKLSAALLVAACGLDTKTSNTEKAATIGAPSQSGSVASSAGQY